MIATIDKVAGIGIYSPAEAAMYARVLTPTYKRWVFGAFSGDPVIDHQAQDGTVTFIDFIQTLAIRAIRTQHRVSLPKIRAAIKMAEHDFGIQYPFARRHTMFLLGNELVIRLNGNQLVQASGRSSGNRLMKAIAEPFLEDLSYGADGLADEFTLYRRDKFEAKMNPSLHFGQPFMPDVGFTTRTLFEAFQSEGTVEAAAEMYEVPAEAVRFACRLYVEYLPTQAA